MRTRRLFLGVTCYHQFRLGEVNDAGQAFVWQLGARRLEIRFVADNFYVSHAEVRVFFCDGPMGVFQRLLFNQQNLVEEFEVRIALRESEISR